MDQLSEEEARKIRILKAVVIGLGILILLALFTLVLGLALGGKSSDEETAQQINTPSRDVPFLADNLEIPLPLPEDATIQEMDIMGNRLALRWRAAGDDRDHIWIIDLESGGVLRKLTQP